MAIGDTDLPEIRFADTLPYTVEANGNVTFNLALTETSTTPITVFFRTLEGTADHGGVDFRALGPRHPRHRPHRR